MTWSGHLTALQNKCANKVLNAFQTRTNLLLWAVTGAGKTEISFKGIAWALENKLRIAIASPRVDVCIELFPRYQAAFAKTPISLLHGKNKEPYQYCQLTICTTHQLLRFQHAFDILIIDEVDAFPFAGSNILKMAAQRAVKQGGSCLFMTATPSKKLQAENEIAYLPLRFHKHLLPQIKLHIMHNWQRRLVKGKLPHKFLILIKEKIAKQQRFLIFVPRIKDLKRIDNILSRQLINKCWETVFAGDEDRIEKVQKMREEKYLFLITTTILERGVTFPGIDVIVFGADEKTFSIASLVQIAGRVGRKASRPFGTVDCFIGRYSQNVNDAQKQIRAMNLRGQKIIDEDK